MGNDGGSIPTRRELVKTGPRAPTSSELKATAHESLAHSWAHCALTDAPIVPSAGVPLAADYLGRIFSYEAVLTALSTPPDDDASHHNSGYSTVTTAFSSSTHNVNETPTQATMLSFGIRTLRDIVRIYPAQPPTDAHQDVWICPLSRKVLGAGTRSVFLVPCGHVFAEVSLREAASGTHACPDCGVAVGEGAGAEVKREDAVVLVLATGTEEVERANGRMDRLRELGLTHSLKKERGRAHDGEHKKRRKRKDRAEGENEHGEDISRRKKMAKEGHEKADATKSPDGVKDRPAELACRKSLHNGDVGNNKRTKDDNVPEKTLVQGSKRSKSP